jgi:hypothetical protein
MLSKPLIPLILSANISINCQQTQKRAKKKAIITSA